MPAAVWQILNVKCMEWLETEVKWTCWNLLEKIREIDGLKLCLQQFDKFWMWSVWNDQKRISSEYSALSI